MTYFTTFSIYVIKDNFDYIMAIVVQVSDMAYGPLLK